MVDTIASTAAAEVAVSSAYPVQAARGATAGGGSAAATPAPASAAPSAPAAATVDGDVSSEIAEYLRASGHEMKFDIDSATKQVVVKVYNSASGELVRQIPDADLLHLAQALRAGNHTLDASA